MINPFDRDFFKFLMGFLTILCISFAIFFFVNKYSSTINVQEKAETKNIIQIKK